MLYTRAMGQNQPLGAGLGGLTVLGAVVRQQLRVLRRDNRLGLLGGALLLASLTALLSGVARNERLADERRAAVNADAHAWASQGVMNPHYAAHFGRYVFKPISVLSAFDPGSLDHLGAMVRLEAHKQSPGSGRPDDAGTALTRFSAFTVASALQMFAPLLVILMGFAAFSGERARTLLVQELGAGVDSRVLLVGRFIALGSAIVAMLALFAGVAAAVLITGSAGGAEYVRLALMAAGYGLYLFGFLAITLGVSALCHSARSALTTLLVFWTCTVLLVPRIAPAIAAHVHPVPSGSEFNIQIADAVDKSLDGDGPREARPERLREMILQTYDARSVDELPVNFSGALLEYSESQSTEIYQRHFAELHRTYERQVAVQRTFSLASPLIGLKPWSAAWAGTDFPTHHLFLTEAEAYRYAFVQQLNRDIKLNRPNTPDVYVSDVARITADLGHFEPSTVPLSDVLRRHWSDLASLVAWALVSGAFALWCTWIMTREA